MKKNSFKEKYDRQLQLLILFLDIEKLLLFGLYIETSYTATWHITTGDRIAWIKLSNIILIMLAFYLRRLFLVFTHFFLTLLSVSLQMLPHCLYWIVIWMWLMIQLLAMLSEVYTKLRATILIIYNNLEWILN